MEADQNQEVPATETQTVETTHEHPTCEEGGDPAPQPESVEPPVAPQPESVEPPVAPQPESVEPPVAPQPESVEPPVEVSDTKPEEQKVEELAQAEVSSEMPMKSAEKLEADVADKTLENPPEVGAPQGEGVQPDKQPEGTEKPTDHPEQKEEPTADSAATPTEAAKEEKPTAAALEAELEEPSGAADVKAELPKEAVMPLFFGWFLISEVEEKIKCSTMEFLKTLDTLQAFKKHLSEFTGEAEKEVDLEQYFQTKFPLHCTTKFCDYGKAEGAKDYAELKVVKDAYDAASELAVVGLLVTPRTFGARVTLTTEQLQLWPPGVDKEGVPASILPSVEGLPVGSRAHVTLGCAAGVQDIQTGLDLLEVLVLQQSGHQASATEELDAGTLSYLGEGRWYLGLREAIACDATFSSYSENENATGAPKKEGGEKKKKPKCAIL